MESGSTPHPTLRRWKGVCWSTQSSLAHSGNPCLALKRDIRLSPFLAQQESVPPSLRPEKSLPSFLHLEVLCIRDRRCLGVVGGSKTAAPVSTNLALCTSHLLPHYVAPGTARTSPRRASISVVSTYFSLRDRQEVAQMGKLRTRRTR